jgi:hypothetical protein
MKVNQLFLMRQGKVPFPLSLAALPHSGLGLLGRGRRRDVGSCREPESSVKSKSKRWLQDAGWHQLWGTDWVTGVWFDLILALTRPVVDLICVSDCRMASE